jgi:hypothetical protein
MKIRYKEFTKVLESTVLDSLRAEVNHETHMKVLISVCVNSSLEVSMRTFVGRVTYEVTKQ